LTGYLLDTHSLVWAIDTPEVLSEPARRAIEAGPVYLSVDEVLWKAEESLTLTEERLHGMARLRAIEGQ
jgi:PIN domain nuclease of toxin-antitoxin system